MAGICSRCKQEFLLLDSKTVEPSGDVHHSVHCPEVCSCGDRMVYKDRRLHCYRCQLSVRAHSPVLYLIGSLKNPRVPEVAQLIRAVGYEVFDDWYAAGPEADDYWQKYEMARGHDYETALTKLAADHVFSYDYFHLNRAQLGVLLLPAGKSGHLEIGYLRGQQKPTYIVFDGHVPERWDVMYKFAKGVYFNVDDLLKELKFGLNV